EACSGGNLQGHQLAVGVFCTTTKYRGVGLACHHHVHVDVLIDVPEDRVEDLHLFARAQRRVGAEGVGIGVFELVCRHASLEEPLEQVDVGPDGGAGRAGLGCYGSTDRHTLERDIERLGRDAPVVDIEVRLAVTEHDHLGRFVLDTGELRDAVAGGAGLYDADDPAHEVLTRVKLLLDETEPLHGLVAGTGLEDHAGGVTIHELVDVLWGAKQYDTIFEHL